MRDWTYLTNPFTLKRITYYKSFAIAQYLNARLLHEQADPEIAAMLIKFNVSYLPYKTEYEKSGEVRDTSKSETLRFNNKIALLPDELRKWELHIVIEFDEKTPEYHRIFPGGRSNIYTGTQIEQLTKLSNLHTKLADYPALASVYNEVGDFYEALLGLHSEKANNFSGVGTASTTLKLAYTTLGNTMFSILCLLISKFVADTSRVEYFFPINMLRTQANNQGGTDEAYSLTIPAGQTVAADISFSVDDKFTVTNTGDASVYYYGAVAATDAAPAQVTELASGQEAEVAAASLGAPKAKYLMFINRDANMDGEVEIILV